MAESCTSGVLIFKGTEYAVTSKLDNHGNSLIVEVEDRLSSDVWKNSFDIACKYNL